MSAKPPIVSIVIASHNHGEYLAGAIESVLAQDYPEVELIVVDDGSTDDTPRVLERYRSRGTMLRQDNAGQARALNRGWAMARGDLLAYLGADDALEPGAVSALAAALAAAPAAMLAYGDYLMIDADSKPLRRVSTGDYRPGTMVSRLVCFPGPATMFRRSAFLAAGPWDESLRQIPDFEFWLRLAKLGAFTRVPETLARYRAHDRSQSFSEVDEQRAEETVQVMERYFRDGQLPGEIRRLRHESLASAHILSARLHLRSGRAAQARTHLATAWRFNPAAFLAPWTYRLLLNAMLVRAREPRRA